jgi:oligopeptide/dipeptide ABC transporter ATP-binding protein
MTEAQEVSPKAVPLLRTRGLCKDFPSCRALDNVDMEVEPREIRGIVGESGSGKTTLARCSLRLLEPDSGSVFFDGQDLAALSPASLRAKRREFQMFFQDPYGALNPAMTVEEILLEPLEIHRIGTRESRRRRMRELLDAVSLGESLRTRRPAELSGGQQQRVGIARGLALDPRLLVADESVSSLDASVQAQILNLLADLKRRYALTLVLISHSLYVIHYLATRVSVLYCGQMVEEADAARFFQGPKHPYSRMLLDLTPAMDAPIPRRAQTLKAGEPVPAAARSCCLFHPHCPQAHSRCRQQLPRLKEIGPGEKVACFLYF